MNISHRHHYIPQFLIRNFADDDGMLWVYDKGNKRIHTKKQYPKSIFYEWDRNLFNLNGQKMDNMEQIYGDLDNLFAGCLNNVLSTDKMSGIELNLIIALASLMKWRTPKIDPKFDELKESISLENLGVRIRPINPSQKADPETIKLIEESEIMTEGKRILLSALPLLSPENLGATQQGSFIARFDRFPSLIGDCPLIEAPNDKHNVLEDFIMPLSSSATFISKKNSKRLPLRLEFYFQRDLGTLHLSEKYVACKSLDHLEKVISIYDNLQANNKTHYILKYMFDFIS
jgi:hypothetical protein